MKEVTIYDIANELKKSLLQQLMCFKQIIFISDKMKKKIKDKAEALVIEQIPSSSNLRTKELIPLSNSSRLDSNFLSSTLAGIEKLLTRVDITLH